MNAARAKPGVISFGTSGPGSMSHLSGELLIRQAGIKLNAVPYKGGILAVNDVVAGHLDMIVSDALPVSQFIKANRVRPLAITSDKRSRLFPDIPTFGEGGVPGLVADNWWGVYLPTGTPAGGGHCLPAGAHQGDGRARRQGEVRATRRGGHGHQPGGIPQLPRRRTRQVQQARGRQRHQGRIRSVDDQPKRQRLSPADRERQIIEGAIDYFAETGFSGQTRELSKRLGITQPLLYRYFENKQALVDRVYETVFAGRWDPSWIAPAAGPRAAAARAADRVLSPLLGGDATGRSGSASTCMRACPAPR